MLDKDSPKWVEFKKAYSQKQAYFFKKKAEAGFVIPGEVFEVTDVENFPDYTPS